MNPVLPKTRKLNIAKKNWEIIPWLANIHKPSEERKGGVKISKAALLIFVVTSCFFLCRVSNVFALLRDDISPKEAREMIESQREKNKVRWQETERQMRKKKQGTRGKQIEEELLQRPEAVTTSEAKKKQTPSSVGLTKSASSGFGEKVVIGLALLGLAITIVIAYRKSKK